MIYCPNLSDEKIKQEFEELVEVLGEDNAYRIWSKNNGNSIDKAPNGEDSKLFKDLLELVDNDRNKAIELKAKVYSPEFTAWFGDWMVDKNDDLKRIFTPEKDVYNRELRFSGIFESNDEYDDTVNKELEPYLLPIIKEYVKQLIIESEIHPLDAKEYNKQIEEANSIEELPNVEYVNNWAITNYDKGQKVLMYDRDFIIKIVSTHLEELPWEIVFKDDIVKKEDSYFIKPKKFILNEDSSNKQKNVSSWHKSKSFPSKEYNYTIQAEFKPKTVELGRYTYNTGYNNDFLSTMYIPEYITDEEVEIDYYRTIMNNEKRIKGKYTLEEWFDVNENIEEKDNSIKKDYYHTNKLFETVDNYFKIKESNKIINENILTSKITDKNGEPLIDDVIKENTYYQLDENEKAQSINNELSKKLEVFLKSSGFSLNILKNVNKNYVAKTDMIKRIVEIVDDKANITTLPEESGHIFVEMLGNNNPLLIKMMNEITNFKIYNKTFETYKNNPEYQEEIDGKIIPNIIKIKKEAIGKAIALEIVRKENNENIENINKLKNWINRVISWLKTKFKKGALERFNNTVFSEAAESILTNKMPEGVSINNLSYTGRNIVYYQLDNDFETTQRELIENLENALIIKTKDGYITKSGKEVSKRVTDYVKRFYRRIFDNKEETEKDVIMRMKGTYLHKVMEHIIKNIISLDVNQNKSIEEIKKEFKNLNFNKLVENAILDLINTNPDFEGLNVNDTFFSIGSPTYNNKINHNEVFVDQLINLGLAKYRNIKEKQQSINKFTGTNGKFKIFNELTIYSEKEDIAGTIDMLVVYSNSSVGIYDWKSVNFKTNDKGEVTVENIPDFKERAWEVQMHQYKRILSEQYNVKSFAETRMIPINVQLNYRNLREGFYNIEAGNAGNKPYLNEVPVDYEMISKEVTGEKYLNMSLRNLFAKRDELRKQLELSKGNIQIKARLERINKIIKGLQLRKEFTIIVDEMVSFINEFNNREHHKDPDNILTFEDISMYMEYANMFNNVLGDMISSIENDEALKIKASLAKSNIENLIKRLGFKQHDLLIESTNIDINEASIEESSMGRNFKSLFNLNNSAFKILRTIVGENQNKIRLEFNEKEKEIAEKTKNLKDWAKNKGISLQDAYNKIIVEVNGTLKLISKYNNLFYKEKQEAIEKKDFKWFENNTLIKKDKNGNYEYAQPIKDRFEFIKREKIKNLKDTYPGKDMEKTLNYEIETWLNKYDITYNKEAIFNKKNYFIKMVEQDKYNSEFWKEATSSGNEALKNYYEMYLKMNEDFSDMIGQHIDGRFISNVSKDLIDSVSENGIYGFKNIGKMITKALETRQYDYVKGTVVDGEVIKNIPLLFLDELKETVSNSEKEEIRKEVENIKDKNGNQKYKGLELEDVINAKIDELARKKGNVHKSRDLSKSLLLFANTAITYKNLKDSEALIQSVLYYLKSGGGFHLTTDKFGNIQKDAFDNYLESIPGIPKKEIELFEKFINAIWYGQRTQGKDKTFKILGKELSGTKIVKNFMQYISLKALGLNTFVAAGNMFNTFSNIMLSGIEGNIYKNALKKTMNLVKSDKKKFFAAGALFETFAHNEKLEKINNISANSLSKIMTMDNAYVLMKKPDKLADTMLLIAMMHRYGLQDGKLVKFLNDDNPNSLINLLKYNENTNSWGIDGLNDRDFSKFRQAVFHMSYKLKGSRSEDNLSATDLVLSSQALMQFRNWMPGVIDNRFGKLKYDDVLLDFNQGRFLVFANEFKGTLKDKVNTLFNITKELFFIKSFSAENKIMNIEAAQYYFDKFIAENPKYKDTLTIEQFLQMREGKLRATIAEVRIVLALYFIVSALGALLFGGEDDDDEKKDKISEFFARNAYRMTNRGLLEMSFFFDPGSTFRSFYISPIAIFKPIKDLDKVFANTIDEIKDEIYGENSPNDKTGWRYYSEDYIPFYTHAKDFFDLYGIWNYKNEP